MFKITIENTKKEETQYIVYGEGEFNFISNINNPTVIPCPNYFELESMSSQYPAFKITNLTPFIVPQKNFIQKDKFSDSLHINLFDTYPLELEEYEILYKAYLAQMEQNPTHEFIQEQTIKENIEYTKTLIKKSRISK